MAHGWQRHALAAVAAALLATAGCSGGGSAPAAVVDGGAGACVGGTEQAVVITQFNFARQAPMGVTAGFDLDQRVSTAGEPTTCGHADLVGPDGAPGVDNQLSLVVPLLDIQTHGAVDALIQAAINNGQLLMAVDLRHLDPRGGNQDCVDLVFRRISGAPLIGTNGFLLPDQTFDPLRDSAPSVARGGVRNGVFEAGPFELALPVALLDARFVLHLHNARVSLRLAGDGALTGVMGGGIAVDELVGVVRGLNIEHALMDLVASYVAMIADLDRRDGVCHQFSAAITFTATTAFVNP